MDRRARWVAGGALALTLIGGGAGIGVASAGGEGASPSESALRRATNAALEHTGGGTVIEAEAGDGRAGYGVEIRREDGTVHEVSLDARFNVIADEPDEDGVNDEGGAGDS